MRVGNGNLLPHTVKWRAREPALKHGSFMTARPINKDGHARIIIMRPETILH